MINIIKWIIIELIIFKKNQFILILGTVWQSLRLSYRTWKVPFISGMTLIEFVIPFQLAWQSQFVIPNWTRHDNLLDCHTEFKWYDITWDCHTVSILNHQVICHTQLSYRKLFSMTMLQIVIPNFVWHDISTFCHTDFNCSMTLAHIVILIFVAWSYHVCHTSSRCCL